MSSIINKIKTAWSDEEKSKKAADKEKDQSKKTTAKKKTSAISKEKTSKKEKSPKKEKKLDKNAHKVVLRPLISEKGTYLSQYNKYLFEVSTEASKQEIIRTIQNMYGIKPVKINIINKQGKFVRYGRNYGRTKSWKKAVITLPEGQSIQVYEGV